MLENKNVLKPGYLLAGLIGGVAVGGSALTVLLLANSLSANPTPAPVANVASEASAPAVQVDSGAVLSELFSPEELPPGHQRVLLTSKSADAEQELRGRPDVQIRHEFDGAFSANVPAASITSLRRLATVTPVGIARVTQSESNARPVCGDGICQGSETRTCAADCAPTPPTRTCSPTRQREYNVLDVNGGQLGSGAGVHVAVLDTGTLDHQDLVSNITSCRDATRPSIRDGCRDRSVNGHGTHVAGVVGANGSSDGLGSFGVAPSSSLLVIKTCNRRLVCFNDDIAAGIDEAARLGADIVNMSFGGSQSPLISAAIARHPGMLFIASSGNDGLFFGTIAYPAANPAVVGVGAHDANRAVADFSSPGAVDDGNDLTIVEGEIEFSAGGVNVEATHNDGCYTQISGTSFSAPTVSGLAAKLWTGSAATTRAMLVTVAQDIASGPNTTVGYDTGSGYGVPAAP